MDYRLVLSVLLVTLSWKFMGTHAQSNSTTTPTVVGANATTVPPVGANATTIPPVGANATTVPPLKANATTVPPFGANATTVPPAGANATTVPPVGANATTVRPVGANATTVPPVGANATTVPPAGANATTVPPVGANATTVSGYTTTTGAATTTTTTIPVAPLTVPITTTDCGSKKLCVAAPTTCDPSTGNQCYFISAKQQSGQLYGFELSGQSSGYIAASLSTSSNQADSHQAYICANNNGAVRFFTGILSNFVVNLTSLNSSNVMGNINSNKIQCTFSATVPNTTTRAAGLSMAVSTGSYNSNTGVLGKSTFTIQTPVVDLSNPNSTISNLVNYTNSNGTNSTSGAYPVTHQQSLMMPALLLIVTILAFTTH